MASSLRRVDLGVLERLLYPAVPVVVTAEYRGRVGGMLAAWWMQASFNPPVLAVAIAPERYTYKLVKESSVFAFNLLDFSHVEKTPYLGDVSERLLPGKLKRAGFHVIRGEALGAPLIAEAAAAVELKLVRIVEAGDHDIFLGEAVAAYAIEDFSGGMWRLESYRPLMYLGRTRRTELVYRVYLTPGTWERRELEYAGGELKPLAQKRMKLMDKIVEKVRRKGRTLEVLEEVRNLLRSEGLEPEDAVYLVEEASRRLSK